MNCCKAHSLLSTERDGPLEAAAQSALEAHLAACPTCRRVQADLAAGFGGWRAQSAAVSVPDAQQEWWEVRRRMRGGESTGEAGARPMTKLVWFWRALPIAAATAIAAVLFFPRFAPDDPAADAGGPTLARANSVEVPGQAASTMVFVDEKSGWLIVWAADTDGRSG